jgi:hypothetical protein
MWGRRGHIRLILIAIFIRMTRCASTGARLHGGPRCGTEDSLKGAGTGIARFWRLRQGKEWTRSRASDPREQTSAMRLEREKPTRELGLDLSAVSRKGAPAGHDRS